VKNKVNHPLSRQGVSDNEDFDRIEGNKIILNGQGIFPKKLIIIEPGNKREYRLIRTQYGKYQLNR
jgi:hypothetical protein